MRIICTNNEKENLIYIISKSPICPSEKDCPIDKNCRQCIESLFDWEIIDKDI